MEVTIYFYQEYYSFPLPLYTKYYWGGHCNCSSGKMLCKQPYNLQTHYFIVCRAQDVGMAGKLSWMEGEGVLVSEAVHQWLERLRPVAAVCSMVTAYHQSVAPGHPTPPHCHHVTQPD